MFLYFTPQLLQHICTFDELENCYTKIICWLFTITTCICTGVGKNFHANVFCVVECSMWDKTQIKSLWNWVDKKIFNYFIRTLGIAHVESTVTLEHRNVFDKACKVHEKMECFNLCWCARQYWTSILKWNLQSNSKK